MAKEREILRLHFEGMSQRDICTALKCGHSKANGLIAAARRAGITWEAVSIMDDADICDLLFPRDTGPQRFAQPDFESLAKELSSTGVTRKLLWYEYCTNISKAGTVPYGYAQFCRLFDRYLKASSATMHLSHESGQRMFVDWAGPTFEVVDHITGEVMKAWLFVACLPYSDIIFAKAFPDTRQNSWLEGHMDAFEYFGGVPFIIVPDNCATATDRSAIYLTIINEQYYEFAAYYQSAIVPARVRKSNDKALVESAVLICERNILAPLRHERFFSIAELNDAIAERLEAINDAPFQKREGSRREVFYSEEHDQLKALPNRRYEAAEYKKVKVSADYHVSIDAMRYSVPYNLIGETLEARITTSEVRILRGLEEVASHRRLYGKKGQYSTEREHMPKKHQEADITWTPERFERWAQGIGPSVAEVIKCVLASKTIVEQTFVPCINILGLAKGGRSELLECACKEVLGRNGWPTYTLIKNTMAAIKARSNTKASFETEAGRNQLGDAGCVRGADFYSINEKEDRS